jgi:small subunit ribosomal protein S16
MPVKLRLQRKGRKKHPFYHIVVADSRAPRDGRFIEKIGTYNPMTKPATIEIDRDKAYDWLVKGAQPTPTVNAILRFKGVLYRKHLMRGVKKGALTHEEAMVKYNAWVEQKEVQINARHEATAKEKADFHKTVFGRIPKVVVAEKKTEAVSAPVVEAPVAVADDLTKIEGIGPKIAEALQAAGIATFAQLAESNPEKIKEVLDAAEGNFAAHDPGTWPQQAQLAAEGKWDELKAWQDELDGGKVVDKPEQEPEN